MKEKVVYIGMSVAAYLLQDNDFKRGTELVTVYMKVSTGNKFQVERQKLKC